MIFNLNSKNIAVQQHQVHFIYLFNVVFILHSFLLLTVFTSLIRHRKCYNARLFRAGRREFSMFLSLP